MGVRARVVWVRQRRKKEIPGVGAKARVVWVCVEYRIEGKGERGGERRH